MATVSTETGGGANPRNLPTVAGHVPAPDRFQADPSVRRVAATTVNALIIGDDAEIVRVLNVVWPTLRKPVVHCEGRRLILPVGREGTLVIRNAHQLVDQDQQRLLEWSDTNAPRARMIACASTQLFTLVENGTFSRCLFDRLKDVQLMLT